MRLLLDWSGLVERFEREELTAKPTGKPNRSSADKSPAHVHWTVQYFWLEPDGTRRAKIQFFTDQNWNRISKYELKSLWYKHTIRKKYTRFAVNATLNWYVPRGPLGPLVVWIYDRVLVPLRCAWLTW